jgi:hypothetical protein
MDEYSLDSAGSCLDCFHQSSDAKVRQCTEALMIRRSFSSLEPIVLISFPTRKGYGMKHSIYAFVRTYGYVHAVHVRLVVEYGNHRITCAKGRETRDITCCRRRFHVERARPLVNVWGFTAPTTHLK